MLSSKIRHQEEKQRQREEKAKALSAEQFAAWKASKNIENFPTLHEWKDAVYNGEYAKQMQARLNAKINAKVE